MLNIVVAHKPEAAGVIEALSLQRMESHRAIYASQSVRLGICGTGRERCSSMTELLLQLESDQPEDDHWLNYGIAGSAGFGLGDLVLAERVHCLPVGRDWRLKVPGNLGNRENLFSGTVETVDEIRHDYQNDLVYEMESAGMLMALEQDAARKSRIRRTTVLKLISDGPDSPLEYLTESKIRNLLDDAVTRVTSILEYLQNSD